MKSTEFYKQVSKLIYPKLKSNGFKKTKGGLLGFYKQLKEYYLVFWFQCSQDGFDEYAGSKFIVEIQISKTNLIGTSSIIRHRLPFFLSQMELETIAQIQNEITDTLRKPDKSHYIFSLAENIQKWYLNKFEKVENNYNNSSDIWFIYCNQSDIAKWIQIIQPLTERIINDFYKTDY